MNSPPPLPPEEQIQHNFNKLNNNQRNISTDNKATQFIEKYKQDLENYRLKLLYLKNFNGDKSPFANQEDILIQSLDKILNHLNKPKILILYLYQIKLLLTNINNYQTTTFGTK